eukprot:scaffold6483_cov101-Isochrysis_galbana.AAC.2
MSSADEESTVPRGMSRSPTGGEMPPSNSSRGCPKGLSRSELSSRDGDAIRSATGEERAGEPSPGSVKASRICSMAKQRSYTDLQLGIKPVSMRACCGTDWRTSRSSRNSLQDIGALLTYGFAISLTKGGLLSTMK